MPIPDFPIPSIVARCLGHLPSTPPSWMLCQTLNQLARYSILPVDHQLLAGRYFDIVLSDAGLTLHLSSDGKSFLPRQRKGEKADLVLSANVADFTRLMLREEDPDTLFFNRRLKIEGDTELGLVVKNLLDSVDWQGTPLERFFAA